MRETCGRCRQRSADISYREITAERDEALHLCQACALELDLPVFDAEAATLDTKKIWADLARDRAGEPLTCPVCGWAFADFETIGLLGCPACYQTFQGDMTRLLERLHGESLHRGKVPYAKGRRLDLKRRLRNARDAIESAVLEERFEDAARLRDEVRDLEEEQNRLRLEGGA